MLQKLLTQSWRNVGVDVGDTILLHSNITRTLVHYMRLGMRIEPQDILASFLQAVGSTGTLLFPLFNFGFASGQPFDIRNTPSKMGLLTEAARCHPGAVRTGHPMYSFAVLGHHADQFRIVDNFSGYGSDSPFALLREMNGKIAVLDLPDQQSMTFYHHVEEMHDVEYRYHKKFAGDYTDIHGNRETRVYGLFVRDLQKHVITHVDPAGELMWQNGLYSGFRPGQECGLRIVRAQEMYELVSEIIASGRAQELLYRTENDVARPMLGAGEAASDSVGIWGSLDAWSGVHST